MQTQKKQKNWLRSFGLSGIVLCALCCLLPVIGSIFGFSALMSLGTHLEKLAMLFLILSGVIFIVYFIRRSKKAKSCDTDCSCPSATQKA